MRVIGFYPEMHAGLHRRPYQGLRVHESLRRFESEALSRSGDADAANAELQAS